MRGTDGDDDVDRIRQAILSGSAYERCRLRRRTHFSRPTTTKLAWQSALLGGLALVLPLYLLFPATVTEFLPSADPAVASPKVVVLGLVGAGIQAVTAVLLVAAAAYRIRRHPLSERQARRVLDVEDVAAYLAFGTGGVTVGATVATFLLGLGGGDLVGRYVRATGGTNPFEASGIGIPVAGLALLSLAGCLTLLAARRYLRPRMVALGQS